MNLFLAISDIILYLLGMVVMYGHFGEIQVRYDTMFVDRPDVTFNTYKKTKLLLGWPIVAVEYLLYSLRK